MKLNSLFLYWLHFWKGFQTNKPSANEMHELQTFKHSREFNKTSSCWLHLQFLEVTTWTSLFASISSIFRWNLEPMAPIRCSGITWVREEEAKLVGLALENPLLTQNQQRLNWKRNKSHQNPPKLQNPSETGTLLQTWSFNHANFGDLFSNRVLCWVGQARVPSC